MHDPEYQYDLLFIQGVIHDPLVAHPQSMERKTRRPHPLSHPLPREPTAAGSAWWKASRAPDRRARLLGGPVSSFSKERTGWRCQTGKAESMFLPGLSTDPSRGRPRLAAETDVPSALASTRSSASSTRMSTAAGVLVWLRRTRASLHIVDHRRRGRLELLDADLSHATHLFGSDHPRGPDRKNPTQRLPDEPGEPPIGQVLLLVLCNGRRQYAYSHGQSPMRVA